ncbi:MAG: threonine--tRNA ligase [Candidatus Micrarchaeota archaeon]|nr:threonine--tRNA ligase [Candidatus Micrarchaeota archaeon]MDE1849998.1 threonine--tRNA ligase [Candidatus Micrarchaeota archaeon]
MKILQLDVDNITYEAIAPEASIYEDIKEKKNSVDTALVLLISVENGDTEEMAEKAMKDTDEFLKKLQRKKLVLYPYAHISNNLAAPREAMHIINHMYKQKIPGVEVVKAPFGWTKKLSLNMKGHPLAEQSRSYGGSAEQRIYKKVKPVSVNTSIVRKSDISGLPQEDHRTIGERLDLFSLQEVSPGMVYWHNNGVLIFNELVYFIREKLKENGYMEVVTPAIANLALWHVSGHIDHYRDNMFTFESTGEQLGLKPMNCPSVMMIYKSRKWSYRELPVRLSDFDKLYRNEISGALTGLFRVREMTQDDAHIFVTEAQLEDEIANLIRLVNEFYGRFGLSYKAMLSTMPDDHLGDEKLWEEATQHLKNALKKNSVEYGIKEKDGAFYGPKIDFQVKDSMGREWQCATIQVDYQLPQRFGLSYVGEDGKEHMPIVVHRVIYGSLERFIAILIEHYKGKFPTWIAPVQVAVVSISEQQAGYAKEVYGRLKAHRIRAELDTSDKTLEYKIRDAKMHEIPYTIIIGRKEAEAKTVSVRNRNNVQKNAIKFQDFIDSINNEITNREGELSIG